MDSLSFLEAYGELRRELTLLFVHHTSELQLSIPQLLIIQRLTVSACSLVELTELTMIDKAAVSRSVTSMENSGLVIRKASEKDQRMVSIQLTNKGRELAAVAIKAKAQVVKTIDSILGKSEQTELKRVMKKLADGIREGRAQR